MYHACDPQEMVGTGSEPRPQATQRIIEPCRLLSLPTELRTQIFLYVLPGSLHHGFISPCWIKGTTALLQTSTRLHDEAARLMYGQATFHLNLVWDCTTFFYQWLLPSGSTHQRLYPFPDFVRQQYLFYMKNFKITVHNVYTATPCFIKQHSTGLTLGVRNQLDSLYQVLKSLPAIRTLHLHFHDDFSMSRVDESVLRPLVNLPNLQSIYISGGLTEEARQRLGDK